MPLRLLFALLALVLMLGLAPSPNARAGDGIASLDYIPQKTMLVAVINAERLRDADLFDDGMSALRAHPGAAQALEMLHQGMGFDITRDVATLIFALPPDVEHTQNFLIIVEGAFDEQRFVSFSKSQGASFKQRAHRKVNLYELDRDAALAFHRGRLLFGTPDSLEAAIDVQQDRAPDVRDNATLDAIITGVDASRDLWIALELPESFRKLLGEENAVGREVARLAISLDIQRGVAARADLTMTDPEHAATLSRLLRDATRAAAGDASLKALGVDRALHETQVTVAEQTITVLFALTPKETRTLLEALGADLP